MIELRPFQMDIIKDLRRGYSEGHLRQLLALATGGGKTVVASHLIRNATQKGKRSMFVVDRIELVGQAARHLEALGMRVGVLQGEATTMRPTDEVVVASIQTLRSRGAPPVEFVVIDEAHILHDAHIALMTRWNALPFIGLSATPLRPDLGKYFTRLVRGPSVAALTEQGFLTPARAYCPSADALEATLAEVATRAGDYVERDLSQKMNQKELVGDIISTWQSKAEDRPTLVFAVDIAHSKSIIDDFLAAGISAAHLDAYTPRDERAEIIGAFRAGDVRVLSSVNVLGIGFDVPDAACAVLARPTLSEALHMQQLGRVIRPAPGKVDALILDHAGNTVRFGLPQHFEVPDLDAEERKSTKAKRKERRLTTCPSCHAVIDPGAMVCPACGVDRPVKSADIVYRDGRLIEFGSGDDGAPGPMDRKSWYRAFLWTAGHRGHKSGWAYYAFQEKFKDKPPYTWRRLTPSVPTDEQARWIRHYYIRSNKRRAA